MAGLWRRCRQLGAQVHVRGRTRPTTAWRCHVPMVQQVRPKIAPQHAMVCKLHHDVVNHQSVRICRPQWSKESLNIGEVQQGACALRA